jgi:MFS family permease
VGTWQIGYYRQILGEPAYRRFWLGATGSVLGDAMTRAALTWHVWATTGSAEALGWLMLCYTGPLVVSGLLAGALLDRFDRRRVMLADSLLRGVTMALIPLLATLGRLELWHLYAAAVVYGTLMMISLAGGPALIPGLVRREHLSAANALEMLSFTLGGMIGPPLAGLLIAAAGAPTVLLVDALTFAGFALALATLPPGTDTTEPATRSGGSDLRRRSACWSAARCCWQRP